MYCFGRKWDNGEESAREARLIGFYGTQMRGMGRMDADFSWHTDDTDDTDDTDGHGFLLGEEGTIDGGGIGKQAK